MCVEIGEAEEMQQSVMSKVTCTLSNVAEVSTKRSMSGMISFNLSSVGIELSATNADVISSYTFHVAHAVFLPMPANEEV